MVWSMPLNRVCRPWMVKPSGLVVCITRDIRGREGSSGGHRRLDLPPSGEEKPLRGMSQRGGWHVRITLPYVNFAQAPRQRRECEKAGNLK